MFTKLILKLTHRLWNRQISRILCRAQSDGLINNYQLHELAAAFDPTQRHKVYGNHEAKGFNTPRHVSAHERCVAVLLLMCLSLTLAGCNSGEFAHAASVGSPASSSFIITKHEPCSATAPESSRGNALQPTDGAGQGLVDVGSVDHGAIESIKLIQEQANEILDLKSELAELREQNNELTKGMGRLLSELGELKRSPQVAAAIAKPRYPRILFFHAKWCKPCHVALDGPNSFPDWLKASGYQVDDTDRAHVQLVDFDANPELARKHGITRLPSIVLLRGENDFSPASDYAGRQSIIDLFDTLKNPPAAASPTINHHRPQRHHGPIAQLLLK